MEFVYSLLQTTDRNRRDDQAGTDERKAIPNTERPQTMAVPETSCWNGSSGRWLHCLDAALGQAHVANLAIPLAVDQQFTRCAFVSLEVDDQFLPIQVVNVTLIEKSQLQQLGR